MNIAEAKQTIRETVEAYLKKDEAGLPRIHPSRQRPLFLIGAPGIGKTAIVSQVAAEMGIGLVSYSMTHHTRQSAIGLPFIVQKEYDGKSFDISEYTMSEIIASVYDYQERTGKHQGILFLDEINCVSETLYPSMLQFLQFKTFGRHAVPTDWIVVCAGNPPEYNKSVHEFDIVTLDRLRKIEIEPDYNAWKAYAHEIGTHPAVTSFLEVKHDCFYSVESSPTGKKFVTARSWNDLADILGLYEEAGNKVDISLIAQFLQSPEIAERFSAYYDLFNKYRSDYQVDQILRGNVPESIYQRAQEAAFDERLALLGLILDALGGTCDSLLLHDDVLIELRDALRAIKPAMLESTEADAKALLSDATERVEFQLKKLQEDSNGSTDAVIRKYQLTARALKEFAHNAEVAQCDSGEAVFSSIQNDYSNMVHDVKTETAACSVLFSNAFDFVSDSFGNDREMLVFITELTSRASTMKFINRYGCEPYYAYNKKLLVSDTRNDLLAKIEAYNAAQEGSTANVSIPDVTPDMTIDEYYKSLPNEFHYASMCKMSIPSNLDGMTVLDIGCRRGKGVFKLSDRVGAKGLAIGLDWTPEFIAEAKQKSDRAYRETGLPANNMQFICAYPENMMEAGVKPGSCDLVFLNSALNTMYDPYRVLGNIALALSDKGTFICETVVADGPRDPEVVKNARILNNTVQSAFYREDFENMLHACGLSAFMTGEQHPVRPETGYISSYETETAESSESVNFIDVVYTIGKGQKKEKLQESWI